jgi:hypothetical protein
MRRCWRLVSLCIRCAVCRFFGGKVGNDVVVYVLHSSSDNCRAVQILARSMITSRGLGDVQMSDGMRAALRASSTSCHLADAQTLSVTNVADYIHSSAHHLTESSQPRSEFFDRETRLPIVECDEIVCATNRDGTW